MHRYVLADAARHPEGMAPVDNVDVAQVPPAHQSQVDGFAGSCSEVAQCRLREPDHRAGLRVVRQEQCSRPKPILALFRDVLDVASVLQCLQDSEGGRPRGAEQIRKVGKLHALAIRKDLEQVDPSPE